MVLYPVRLLRLPTMSLTLSHTHSFVTHHLSHTQLCHCHAPSFTHTHKHRALSHTQLCLTHTHNLFAHHLSHTTATGSALSRTTSSHTTLSHTIFRGRRGACRHLSSYVLVWPGRHGSRRHRRSFCRASRDIDACFAWQAWHSATLTLCFARQVCGSYGAYDAGLPLHGGTLGPGW